MFHARSTAIALALVVFAAPAALAQNVDYVTEGGIRYQVITSETQRPLTTVRYEPRESTVYQPRYTTDMQESVRTYQVPVTEQQWVLGYQRTWNIFAPPVPSYRLMPVTRWQTRTETVRIPITKREYVPVRQVQQVPITDTRIAKETVVRKVAISMAGEAPTVARNESIGGASGDGEPPSASSFGSPIDRHK
ncbi:MAG: hypothetical protein WD063_17545 [Pirellulales bacterium]